MISTYLRDTISWEKFTSFDSRNEPSYAAAADLKARIDWKESRIQDVTGETIIAIGPIYVVYNTAITHDDKITISGVKYAVVTVEHGADFSRRWTRLYIK